MGTPDRTDRRPASAELTDRLYAAAQHHALRAQRLSAGVAGEHDRLDAAACAGGAVELLSKAVLVQRDPRLIARGEAVHHHLLDAILGLSRDRPTGSTVDAGLALGLAVRVDASLGEWATAARKVLEARNNAIHAALAPSAAALQELLAEMAGFVTAAAATLGHTSADFWGESSAAVDVAVAQHSVSTKARALEDVDMAKSAYERLVGRLDEAARTTIIGLLQGRASTRDDLDAEVDCPACGNVAQVAWSAEADGEWDDGEVVYYGYFLLSGLQCPVCGLELDGEAVEALGLDLPDPHVLSVEADFGDRDDWRDYVDDYEDDARS